MIAENVKEIRRRIAAACQRAQRQPEDVSLIAVTKMFPSSVVQEAISAGVADIGENYVQELLAKREDLRSEQIRWHFIGHLQTNKIRQIAGWIDLIQTIDSDRLAYAVSNAARDCGRTVNVMIEVNTSGEATKFGVAPAEASGLVREIHRMPNLRPIGLMTIGPLSPDPGSARSAFRALRELRDRLESEGMHLPHLSMGMTGDFEIAIEEGSTMVRLGTAIFGKRPRAVKENPLSDRRIG